MRRLSGEMNRCSYCGKEYANNVTVCPLDGEPIVNREAQRKQIVSPRAVTQSAFDVKLVAPISSAGSYRVFVERNDLLFILIEGGSKSILAALAPLLGPLGGLIPLVLWLFTKKEAKDRLKKIEQQSPEDLLRENDRNFKLYQAEIRDASIEPPSFIATSGKAGRLMLLVRHGEKLKFEFSDAADINQAIHLLKLMMGSSLRINVEWNGQKHQYEKKKTN
jgi:hypothetical protein